MASSCGFTAEEAFPELEAVSKFNSGDNEWIKDSSMKEDEADIASFVGHDSHHVQDLEDPNHGTEGLVRGEARLLRVLRGALIILLVTAAMLTGIFTHRLSVKNQIDAFTQGFQIIATDFTEKLNDGIENYLFQSYTLSEVISAGLYAGDKPNLPDITLANLDGLATSLRLQARAINIVWSPLLTTKSQRDEWEIYAESTQQTLSSSSLGQYPACYLCGKDGQAANPNKQIQVPGFQSVTCKTAQQYALEGAFSPDFCVAGTKAMPSFCGCTKGTASSPHQVTSWKVSDGIFRLENGTAVHDHGPAPFSPVWQISPAAGGKSSIMFNQMSDPLRRKAINAMIQATAPVISESLDPTKNAFYNLMQLQETDSAIIAVLFYPVYKSPESFEIVGSLAIDFSWKFLFELGLTTQSDGTVMVLENTCRQAYTYKVVGDKVNFLGAGDLHDPTFDSMVIQSSVNDIFSLLSWISPGEGLRNVTTGSGCAYNMRVYPSNEMRSRYITSKPWVETIGVVSIFVFTSLVFWLYDLILRRLQLKVMNSAKRSEDIVFSLFPAVVRDRLYQNRQECHTPQSTTQYKQETKKPSEKARHRHSLLASDTKLKNFLAQPISNDMIQESEPIADLFPHTTILFADIAGFTSWSSGREPAQVFKLLETLYGAFDKVAKKLGVFKIETIGDCYVAVSGLPEPRDDHAVIMVKFAFECLIKMEDLTKTLEPSLGPGTADLAIRVGLHSGPVTGGVLRGERARFQLFGDTMNTASRMESNSKVNRIHVSKETAELLIKAGKSEWVEARNELIPVKGKGDMQTFWVKPLKTKRRENSTSEITIRSEDTRSSSGHKSESLREATGMDEAFSPNPSPKKHDRLIAWSADLLEQFLQQIVAKRQRRAKSRPAQSLQDIYADTRRPPEPSIHVVDEIAEIISTPEFDAQIVDDATDPSVVDSIGSNVRTQLRHYVAKIASLYHDNAFHNFEHASHVTMSASKLLKRNIAPNDVSFRFKESDKQLNRSTLFLSRETHENTYGISSDPLMQFAVVFSALIHDVDHTGLQNRQLVQRNDPLALTYRGRSVAEQHSVRCAWDTLMEDKYADLRHCIYQTDEERLRFRQIIINAVMATDIADKDLQEWRQNRWKKAFHEREDSSTKDRKATLVLEYILQASDVAPTMQHWSIYQKWNQRLFEERYIAYVLGDDEEDPSLGWYRGELAFFDNYVIPLARNLKETHAFDVSCDNFLANALENRREWELKGKQIVNDMAASQKALMSQLS